MDDFNICKNALIFFNYELTQSVYDDNSSKNIKICKLKLDQAKRKVQHESCWSFLVQKLTLVQQVVVEDITTMGYSYSFTLPTDLLRITKVYSERPYQRIAGRLLTNDPLIEVYGMLNVLPTDIPLDFEDLISIALAFIISPLLVPGTTAIIDQIIKQYSWTVESLINSDLATRS